MSESSADGGASSADWDEIRSNFEQSIMVDTPLKSLAENVGMEWPIKSPDENPKKYVNMDFSEISSNPNFLGNPQRVDLLIAILKETLAFDDPFGDMVEQVEAASETQDNISKNVARLGLPIDYPIDLTNLSEDTKLFCKTEDLESIGDFIEFSKNMSRNIVVGGDFRSFLNSLAHIDDVNLAKVLPFRPGSTGVHYAEAVGLVVDRLSSEEKVTLLKRYGGKVSEEEAAEAKDLSEEEIEQLEETIEEHLTSLGEWFTDGKDDLEKTIAEGGSVERYFMVLDNPAKETIACNIVRSGLGLSEERRGGGFLSRIGRLFKK